MRLSFKDRLYLLAKALSFRDIPFDSPNAFMLMSQTTSGESKAWQYLDFAEGGYRNNPAVYSCIKLIIDTVASIHLVVQKNGEIVDPKKATGQTKNLITLLKRPSIYRSQPEWLKVWALYFEIAGITYLQGNGLGFKTEGEIVSPNLAPELQLLRPDRVKIKHANGVVTAYILDEKQAIEPKERVLFVLNPDPIDEFAGMPPINAAEELIKTSNLGQIWNRKVMQNEGRIGGAMSIDAPNLSPEKVALLQAQFQKMYGGSENAGKTIFLSRLAQYTRFADSPKELDWAGSTGVLNRGICNVFGVPSQLLGDPDTSKFSNYKEARKALYQDVSLPLTNHLAGELNYWLANQFDPTGNTLIVTETSHIEALREDDNDLYKRQLDAKDILLIDERRALLGYPPLELGSGDGEKISVPTPGFPGQLSQLDKLKQVRSRSVSRETNEILEHVSENSLYRTQESRDALVDATEDLQNPWESKWRALMREFWKVEEADFLESVNKFKSTFSFSVESGIEKRAIPPDLPGDIFADLNEDERLAELLRELQFDIVVDFGAIAVNELVDTGLLFKTEGTGIREFLANDIADRSKLINKTTAKQLRIILQKATDEGVGFQETKLRIQEYYKNISSFRAEAIARTEVGRAQSIAKQEGFRQAGTNFNEWVTARDEIVRDSHVAVDGEVTKVGEEFSNGLIAPRLGGDAAEVINCRCVLAPLKNPEDAI